MSSRRLIKPIDKPACESNRPEQRAFQEADRSDTGGRQKSHSTRDVPLILIADDDTTLRMMASEALRCSGFEVLEAGNGVEALAAIEEHRPDVVLLDVMMPEMDGFMACRTIRDTYSGDNIPVVMMTALEDHESINKAYEVGATDFTTKPVNWVIIKERIRYILRAREAEGQLVKSEARHRALLHAIPDAMLLISRDGRLLEFKPSLEPNFLTSLTGEIGKPIVEALPEDLSCEISASLERTLQTGSTQLMEQELTVDDRIRYGEIRIVPVEEQGNEALAIVRDITDRKQAVEALKASELKYRLLVEHQTDLIIKMDAQGKFLFASPSYCAYFCMDPEEVLDTHFTPEVHEADRDATEKALRGLQESSSVSYLEHRVRAGGAWRWLNWSYTAIRNDEGEVESIIGVGRDINDRKLLEDQLTQSQKLEAIGTLAGGVSHDFNNLLQTILGYSELALSQDADQEIDRSMLEEILTAARRGADLTRQLLTFSRKVESKKEMICLNDHVGQVEKLLERTIMKSIAITCKLEPDIAPVMADSVQVEQVLMNLLLNARDAMPEGGTISIETSSVELDEGFCRGNPNINPGDYISIRVADTGHGIDEETRQHIFEPFFTTKDVGKGTGLGLSMVFGIIQNHRGHIECESRPGKGTVFTVYWPVPAGDQTREDSSATAPFEALSLDPALCGNETVLIADDEAGIRDLVVDYLQSYGYKVLTAENGLDALEQYEAQNGIIDLVILDLSMPVMDGRKCLEELRGRAPDVKILMATGELLDEESGSELNEQTSGFIGKPYRLNELALAVREALGSGLNAH